jgi:hypothetical protein
MAHVGQDRVENTLPSVGEATSAGTRFRIVRPHARGGLGQVFVAKDQELNREVALKEIQERHAHHAESRARFLLEAEVTGGLEHPGIVPVYGLGSYQDGRPYYAMRFIRGDSLKEAIAAFHAAPPGARLPSPPAANGLPSPPAAGGEGKGSVVSSAACSISMGRIRNSLSASSRSMKT